MQASRHNNEAGAAGSASYSDAIAQRFDTVDVKLDLLLSYLQLLEAQSDDRWRAREAKAIAHADSGDLLSMLGEELGALSAKVQSIGRLREQVANGDGPSMEVEALTTAKLDPIVDQMLAVGDKIAAVPARSDTELAVKALAIFELGEEKSDDIVHRLAGSLAQDILARVAAAAQTA